MQSMFEVYDQNNRKDEQEGKPGLQETWNAYKSSTKQNVQEQSDGVPVMKPLVLQSV